MTLRLIASRVTRGWFGSIFAGFAVLSLSTLAAADDGPTAIDPTGSSATAPPGSSAIDPTGSSATAPPGSSASNVTTTSTSERSAPALSMPPALPLCAPPAEPPMVDAWYGYQTLAVDGAALAIGLASIAVGDSPAGTWIGEVSGATYAAGTPIVHLAHHHTGKALASLGTRIGLPAALALTGAFLFSATGGDDGFDRFGNAMAGAVVGTGIGAVGASVIDAVLFARERVPASPPHDTVGAVKSWTPTVSVFPHGATVGLAGTIF